jgi:hypothetical protein
MMNISNIKPKMNRKNYINLDIFNTRILCFDSYESLVAHIKACDVKHDGDMDIDPKMTAGMVGFLFYDTPIMDEKGVRREADIFLAVNNPSKNLSTVVHESVHAAIEILDHIGAPHSVEHQEVMAYTVDHIFDQYCNMFVSIEAFPRTPRK